MAASSAAYAPRFWLQVYLGVLQRNSRLHSGRTTNRSIAKMCRSNANMSSASDTSTKSEYFLYMQNKPKGKIRSYSVLGTIVSPNRTVILFTWAHGRASHPGHCRTGSARLQESLHVLQDRTLHRLRGQWGISCKIAARKPTTMEFTPKA